MSPAWVLFLLAVYANTTGTIRRRIGDLNPFGNLQVFPRPVYLPIVPYYEVDIPEQGGKMFGGVSATRYETIIVRETIRPVCLLVDRNVPSCDHFHDNDFYDPKKPPKNGRRPMIVDYDSYFVEPSRPNVKIEITEIPYRGAYLMVDPNADDSQSAASAAPVQETPPLPVQQAVRPVTEDVIDRRSGRQLLTGAIGAAGTALTALGLGGVGGAVANGLLGGAAGALVGSAANAGTGGRPQMTMYVTRVEKVVDDRVTATLVPKNCMPGLITALKPCLTTVPYPDVLQYHVQLEREQDREHEALPDRRPPLVTVDLVSKVTGLVQDFVEAQTATVRERDGNRHRKLNPQSPP